MKTEPETVIEAGYNKDATQQQRLITVLNELEEEVEKQNSFRHTFVKGALHGLGTVIGATVLLAILGSVLALAIKYLGIENLPFLGEFIENVVLEQLHSRNININ